MRVSRFAQLLTLAAAGFLSQQASAYTIAVLPAGTLSPPGASVVTFDEPDVTVQPYLTTAPYGTLTEGGATFSESGIVMNNEGQGSAGLYAQPYGDGTNYMAVLGGGSETIAYSGPRTSFGLYWGSVDAYNSLQFYDGSTLEATVTGTDAFPPLLANGGQTSFASNGYVMITGLPAFTSVVVGSSSNSFEFDNVVAAPEPSTWALIGIGFVGIASVATGRSRRDRLAPGLA
jgi:hypothetical protein